MTTIKIPMSRPLLPADEAVAVTEREMAAEEHPAEQAEGVHANIARAFEPILENVSRIEAQHAESLKESHYAEVKAEAIQRMLQLRESLTDTIDPDTHKARFDMGVLNIKKYVVAPEKVFNSMKYMENTSQILYHFQQEMQ